MKKFLTLFFILIAFIVSDTFAKSRSSSWGGGSKSTSSWGSKKSTSSWSSKKSTSSWGSKKSTSTKPKAVSTSTTKPKAVSTNKLDTKQTKKVTSSTTAKKYASKKEAETAARKELASKNSYTSPKPPTTRPEYVPTTVNRNGVRYDVDYHRLPNGSYGYGYRDPSTGLIVSLLAADMMMDAAMMNRYGYSYGPSQRTTHTTHVVHHDRSEHRPMGVMGWILTFFIIGGVFGIIIYIIRINS